MKFIGTLFLGIIIAFASLVVQVFITIISDIFFGIPITIQYSPDNTILYTLILITIAETIEEILRYIVIKKSIVSYTHPNMRDALIYGSLLGIGFAGFEIILLIFNQSLASISLLSILPVLIIHITLSIFLLYIATKKQSPTRDIPYILIAIIFHVLSNLLLFYLLTS